jgi:hypothetical protein
MQSLSRRNLVAIAEPDPIFAAIERWKEADAALAAAIRAKDDEAQDGACSEVCMQRWPCSKPCRLRFPAFARR